MRKPIAPFRYAHPRWLKVRGKNALMLVTVGAVGLATASAAAQPGSADQGPPPAGGVEPAPFHPPVADPMLAPPPEAPQRIGSWDEALATIRAQSPDYISNYESVNRARAQKRIALAAVLPVLTGQASYTHQFSTAELTLPDPDPGITPPSTPPIITPPRDVGTFGAGLAWSIVNPRGIYGVGTADRNIDVTRLSFEDRRRIIAESVVAAMLSSLAAARVADLNRVSLRAALERLVLTQTRQQFGQGTALDVDRAQQDVESARNLLIGGDESLRQSREALGVALGSQVPMAPPGDLDLEEFEGAVARTCRLNDQIERRPDVRAARGRLDIAERALHDAELQFAPTLSVNSQLSYSTTAVLGPNTLWSLQGVVNVPFYDGGVRYGAMRDARAAIEQARQALVSARLGAIVGSAQAQRAVGVLQSQRDVARQERDLAARIDWRTRDGYAHGLGTSLDLVTSAVALRQAEINLALLDFQVGQARANAVLTNAECVY
jgi:outer membrane protein, multidrug efflux system